jgi:aldose 1-epimerase
MDDAALAAGDVEASSCFPLTPFSNRVRAGRFVFRTGAVTMPLNVPGEPHVEHGHGWQRPWAVVDKAADGAALLYTHAADDWPYPYEMRQAFRLLPDRLEIGLSARNTGVTAMPYGFGLHPYFPRTPQTTLSARISGMWETDDEAMPTRLCQGAGANLDAGLAVDRHAVDALHWLKRACEIRWPNVQPRSMTTAARLSGVYCLPARDISARAGQQCDRRLQLAETGRTDTECRAGSNAITRVAGAHAYSIDDP